MGTLDRQMKKCEQRKWKCITNAFGKSEIQFYFCTTGYEKDENRARKGKFMELHICCVDIKMGVK